MKSSKVFICLLLAIVLVPLFSVEANNGDGEVEATNNNELSSKSEKREMKSSKVFICLLLAIIALVPLFGVEANNGDGGEVEATSNNELSSSKSENNSGVDEEDEIDDLEGLIRAMNERSLKKGFNAWAGRRNAEGEEKQLLPPRRGFNAWAGRRSLQQAKFHRMYDKRRPWGGIARF